MKHSDKSIYTALPGLAMASALSSALLVLSGMASWSADGQSKTQAAPSPGAALNPARKPEPQPTQSSPQTSSQPSPQPSSQPSSGPSPQTSIEPPVERILLQPGKSLSINMATEDIVCTNDVELARKQKESYPDSPEASFIYAVALSRTSHVEDALKEVRRARRLAEKQGGPSYFDKMIDTYEKMLTYYPDDNQVRYHLAWAYYMKAYVLAKYSHLANTPQAKYKEWVAQAANPKAAETNTNANEASAKAGETAAKAGETAAKAGETAAKAGETAAKAGETAAKAGEAGAVAANQSSVDGGGTIKQDESNDVLKNIQKASNTISSASPQAIPQVQKYYDLATAKLDDLLNRDPGDVWARVYRAYLHAEASGDLVTAMSEWQKVKDQQPLNPAAYFFLGQGYLKQGNLKECLSNVSKAVALRAVGN